jgi:outer membrane murein-binding lipoprotein Lpp
MIRQLVPLAAIAVLMLAGCQETPAETAQDVSDARVEAAQNINAAREDANQEIDTAARDVAAAQRDFAKTDERAANALGDAESAALTKTAHANFDVAEAEAEGRNSIAVQKCEGFIGIDKDACLSSAAAILASELAVATTNRDTELVAAERR